MQFLKKLMLSRSYFERVPANEIVANQGERINLFLYRPDDRSKDGLLARKNAPRRMV